jgi:hypothetical protein
VRLTSVELGKSMLSSPRMSICWLHSLRPTSNQLKICLLQRLKTFKWWNPKCKHKSEKCISSWRTRCSTLSWSILAVIYWSSVHQFKLLGMLLKTKLKSKVYLHPLLWREIKMQCYLTVYNNWRKRIIFRGKISLKKVGLKLVNDLRNKLVRTQPQKFPTAICWRMIHCSLP